MSDSESDKDKRKKNFSVEEREILTRAIRQYDTYLHGAESARTSKAKKQVILRKITLEVNTVGHETRTWREIQKKINDMRRRVRDKVAKIKRHARATGGGPSRTIKLTPEEEVIASCLEEEQVAGLEGFDSSEVDPRADPREAAGPSTSSSQRTPRKRHHGTRQDPEDSEESSLQDVTASGDDTCTQTLDVEEVIEEQLDVQQEDVVYLGEEETPADVHQQPLSAAPPRTPTRPGRGTPPRTPAARGTPLRTPAARGTPLRTPAGRGTPLRTKATTGLVRTRQGTGDVTEGLEREQSHQTKHMADMAVELHSLCGHVASFVATAAKAQADNGTALQSIANTMQERAIQQAEETSGMRACMEDANANSAAMATCMCEQSETLSAIHQHLVSGRASTPAPTGTSGAMQQTLQLHTAALEELTRNAAGIASEVRTLGASVRANTAAMVNEGRHNRRLQRQHRASQMQMQAETYGVLTRIAIAMEGMQAASSASASRSTTPTEDPTPDAPSDSSTRHLRSRSLGTRPGPRDGR